MGGGDARKHRMIIFSQNSLIILFTFCTKFENGFQKFIIDTDFWGRLFSVYVQGFPQ